MTAHHRPALLHLAPQLPAVLGAFLTGHSAAASVSPGGADRRDLCQPALDAEVALVILGFVWSGWLAWGQLRSSGAGPMDRFAAAWIMLLLTSSAALFTIYQPAAARGRPLPRGADGDVLSTEWLTVPRATA